MRAGKYRQRADEEAEKGRLKYSAPALHLIHPPPTLSLFPVKLLFAFLPVVARRNPPCCLNIKWRKGEIMEQQGRRRKGQSGTEDCPPGK